MPHVVTFFFSCDKLIALAREVNKVENGWRIGGMKKLSKFIVDWENGMRVACNNGENLAGNMY